MAEEKIETEQSEEVMFPSTPENQQATQKAVEKKEVKKEENNNKAVFDLAKNSVIARQQQPDTILPNRVIKSEKYEPTFDEVLNEAETLKAEQQKSENENEKESKARLSELQSKLNRATELGIQDQFPSEDKLELESLQKRFSSDLEEAEKDEEKAVKMFAEAASTATPQQVNRKIAEAQDQVAADKAMQKVELDQQQDFKSKLQELNSEVDKEREELKAAGPMSFWGPSFWEGFRVRMAGALLGAGGNPQLGVQTVNDAFNKWEQDRKLPIQEALRKKQQFLESTMQDLDVKAKQSKNHLTQEKINLTKQQLKVEQDKVQSQRLKQKMLQSGGNLPLEMLSDKERERVVVLEPGKVQLAINKRAAEKFREYYETAQPNIENLDRLTEFTKDPTAWANLKKRAEANSLVTQLVGGLRLELFGPGVLTKVEQDMARDIIGNPTKILSLGYLEAKKLQTIKNKLSKSLKLKAKGAGVTLPRNIESEKREAIIKRAMDQGLDQERAEALADKRINGGR